MLSCKIKNLKNEKALRKKKTKKFKHKKKVRKKQKYHEIMLDKLYLGYEEFEVIY